MFAYLLDTGSPSLESLPPAAIREKNGWLLLEEDDTGHRFAGDAVLLNDKLVVVLRQGGAEVYVRDGATRRATLFPERPETGSRPRVASLGIIENSPGAVTVRAGFDMRDGQRGAPGEPLNVDFRLITGQSLLETHVHDPGAVLSVEVPTEYVVIPDFFADDVIYDARNVPPPGIGLPTENLFLALVEGGNGIVACVWGSREQEGWVTAAKDNGSARINSLQITSAGGGTLWTAFLENDGIWYVRPIQPFEMGQEVMLPWRPPFPAYWRATFASTHEATSRDFPDAGSGEPAGVVEESGTYAGWSDDGAPYVACSLSREAGEAAEGEVAAVVYPLDRTRKTPLDVFCIVDVMRSTLGVGACQYVLDLEGLDAQANPTPAGVMDWVESLFRKGRDARYEKEIGERTAAMVVHVRDAQERIERYAGFARDVERLCNDAPRDAGSAHADILRIVSELARAASAENGSRDAPQRAAALAREVQALTGEKGAYSDCQRLGGELRAIGRAQDRALSKCRMAVRRLRHCCRVAASGTTGNRELALRIVERTERMLRGEE